MSRIMRATKTLLLYLAIIVALQMYRLYSASTYAKFKRLFAELRLTRMHFVYIFFVTTLIKGYQKIAFYL